MRFLVFLFTTVLTAQVGTTTQQSEASIAYCFENKIEWSLIFQSSGCFHHTTEQMYISFSGDSVFLHRLIEGKEQPKILLNADKLNVLIEFERQLLNRTNNYGGCTTVDSYVVNSEFSSYTIKDSSCAWNGYSSLIEQIK
ncbi:hypothetical protein [Winogradskyella alexanderae]|uniref:Uncharacterized protein n=1 Tax=Winogradskyella alexanderae TaxID=2877123 RepID=A0ABS7XYF3_9FLAO|nr:hypothetical protein [Winogradskyella alexanderae]MCA0133826.1 hypothetical protein [Winogradskyella alexanderae]